MSILTHNWIDHFPNLQAATLALDLTADFWKVTLELIIFPLKILSRLSEWLDLVSVGLEEVGAGPELRRGVRGEEDLQRQRAARRLVGDLQEIPHFVKDI